MLTAIVLALMVGVVFASRVQYSWAADRSKQRGVCRFVPAAEQTNIPESFRLAPHEFPYEIKPLDEVSERFALSYVTFPSPVRTASEANNTVHCEYYQPHRPTKMPAVIVLHILGGDFELARTFCNALAQQGVASLFVKMPYYGPRREPKSRRRMISGDPTETVEGMTQAVLDIRRAAAWLAGREEIDAQQIGIFGISLGGITGGLAMMIEPRINSGCLLLAGGDVAGIMWEFPGVATWRQRAQENGYTRERLVEELQKVDPVTYADNLNGRRILMLNAKEDEVIPKRSTEGLWKAWGEPEIVWYPGGHYSAAWSMFDAVQRTMKFFAPANHNPALGD